MSLTTARDLLAPWHQRIEWPDGVVTGTWPTESKCSYLMDDIDLHGLTALDVGCMSGMATRWMEKRGAEVIPFDVHPRCQGQYGLVQKTFGLKANYRDLSIYDLPTQHDIYQIDVVLMLGVYYHLRHPLLGLEAAWAAADRVLIIEGEVLCQAGVWAQYTPGEYKGDGTNWWIPTVDCLRAWCEGLPGVRSIDCYHPFLEMPSRAAVRIWK